MFQMQPPQPKLQEVPPQQRCLRPVLPKFPLQLKVLQVHHCRATCRNLLMWCQLPLQRATMFQLLHRLLLQRCERQLHGDGEKVVSGARDGTVRVWETESGQVRFVLQGFTAYLGSLHVSPTCVRPREREKDSARAS